MRAAGVLPLCLKSSGGVLQVYRRGGVCLKRSGDAPQACSLFASRVLEACCRCKDVEEFASRGLEAGSRRSDRSYAVRMSRHALQARRLRGMEA